MFLRYILPLVIFFGFSYRLLAPNLSAGLSIIDDHEIAMFLGQDGKIKAREVPKLLLETEVGEWGENLRFRPIYYLLRVKEAALFGGRAELWYGARIVYFTIAFYLIYLILSLYFPFILSYLFVFYTLTQPYWPDLLTRLGPSEIYAVPASLLFTFAGIKILRGQSTYTYWLMFALGYVVSVGSKENFLFMFPVLLGFALYRFVGRKSKWPEIFIYFLLSIFTLYVAGAIFVATSKVGADVYGTQISYTERLVVFLKSIPVIIKRRHIEPTVVVLALFFFLELKRMVFKRRIGKWDRNVYHHIIVILTLFLVTMSQYILYNNALPTNSRYDFPALFLFPIMKVEGPLVW